MPRPRYKRANRTPAPPLNLPDRPEQEYILPDPNSERARLLEEAMQRNADRISNGPLDAWDQNGRTP